MPWRSVATPHQEVAMLRAEQRTDGVARGAHVPGELEATGLVRAATDMKCWHAVGRDHGPRRRAACAADRADG